MKPLTLHSFEQRYIDAWVEFDDGVRSAPRIFDLMAKKLHCHPDTAFCHFLVAEKKRREYDQRNAIRAAA